MRKGRSYSYQKRRKGRATRKVWLTALIAGTLAAAGIFWILGGEKHIPDPPPAPQAPLMVRNLSSPSIRVYDGEEVFSLPLEEYVLHTLAGEMPASYPLEALKAQAVAARTYTARKAASLGGGGCDRHPEADICTSSAHCQAFRTTEQLQENWGNDFDAYWDKLARAVYETRGLVATYDGKPIEALYHASSGGATENSEYVFANARPYLVSVPTPEEAESKVTCSYKEASRLLEEACPGLSIQPKDVPDLFRVEERSPTGRVLVCRVGEEELTGKEVRRIFSLDSTQFTPVFAKDSLIFETRGYGHGVGMSQKGAGEMAKEGKDFREILTHYYTGIQLTQMERPSSS